MNFLGFGQSADIDIVFDGAENRKLAEIKTEDGKKEKYLLYYDGETVSGRVNVTLKKPGSKLEHQGIKIELIGQIELYYDRGNHHEFISLARELARPGDLIQNTSYPFEFANVEKPYEVYVGSNVRLRYFLRVTIVRRLSDIVREIDIAVHTLCSYPEMNSPIKMEVGIEDCLHIEFEYNKSKYHLKDVIVGKIYFLLVRIKIKHMEIAIIKRETTGSGPNTFTENETIAKYEIMDGAPVKGESIPIRVFLAGYDLTPTMRDINKKFSVRYFLNLVLMDTEDRRYFKQQEITLWRKADKSRKNQQNATNPHVPTHLVGADGEIVQKQQSQQTSHSGSGAEQTSSASSVSPVPPLDPSMGLFTQESPKQETNSVAAMQRENNNTTDNLASHNNSKPQPLPREQSPPPLGATAVTVSSQTHGGHLMNDDDDDDSDDRRSVSQSIPHHVDYDDEHSVAVGGATSTLRNTEEMQRGTADGASAQSQDANDESSSSLFEAAGSTTINEVAEAAAITTTTITTANTLDDIAHSDDAAISNATAATIESNDDGIVGGDDDDVVIAAGGNNDAASNAVSRSQLTAVSTDEPPPLMAPTQSSTSN